jgi:hypothetical protein
LRLNCADIQAGRAGTLGEHEEQGERGAHEREVVRRCGDGHSAASPSGEIPQFGFFSFICIFPLAQAPQP